MLSKNTTLLVLAAGMGSRYGSIKQIDGVGPNGEPILEYSVYDAIKAGFNKVVFVIRESFSQEFKQLIEPKFRGVIQIEYVYQEAEVQIEGVEVPERNKPWGTAHAILVARNKINEPFAVINADDFYGEEAFKLMNDFLHNDITENHYSMVGYVLKNTLSDNGYVSRGVCGMKDGKLERVVEHTEIYKVGKRAEFNDSGVRKSIDVNSLVSMNFWGFHPSIFDELEREFIEFVIENKDNPKAEYFIPLIVTSLLKQNKIDIRVLQSSDKWFGITYKEDKDIVVKFIQDLIRKDVYPQELWSIKQ